MVADCRGALRNVAIQMGFLEALGLAWTRP